MSTTLGSQGLARVECPQHGTWIETLKRVFAHPAGDVHLCPKCVDEVHAGVRTMQTVHALTRIDTTQTLP